MTEMGPLTKMQSSFNQGKIHCQTHSGVAGQTHVLEDWTEGLGSLSRGSMRRAATLSKPAKGKAC